MCRLCLPLNFSNSAFDKVKQHFHAGLQLAQFNIIHCYHISVLQKWPSVFIHACVDCQMHNYKNIKQNKAAILPFSKLSTFLTRVLLWIQKIH